MPLFAKNLIHQRTGGNSYQNKIVSAVNRTRPDDREYIAVRLETPYLRIVILPRSAEEFIAPPTRPRDTIFSISNT